LSDSKAKIESVLGDGRLMLEREKPQEFDLLVMDAFSGDSVPTHLATIEAMKTYVSHLKPGGLLAFNITNHYLDLRPIMAAAAQQLGKVAIAYELSNVPVDDVCRRSHFVLMMDPQQAANLPEQLKVFTRLEPQAGFKPWTDNYSNLLGILKKF